MRKAPFGLLNLAAVALVVVLAGFAYTTTGQCVRYHVEVSNYSKEPIEHLSLSIGDQMVWRFDPALLPDNGFYVPVSDPFVGPFTLNGVYQTSQKPFSAQTSNQSWQYMQDFEVIAFDVAAQGAQGSIKIKGEYGPLYSDGNRRGGFHFTCLDLDVMKIIAAAFQPERRRALLVTFPAII